MSGQLSEQDRRMNEETFLQLAKFKFVLFTGLANIAVLGTTWIITDGVMYRGVILIVVAVLLALLTRTYVSRQYRAVTAKSVIFSPATWWAMYLPGPLFFVGYMAFHFAWWQVPVMIFGSAMFFARWRSYIKVRQALEATRG